MGYQRCHSPDSNCCSLFEGQQTESSVRDFLKNRCLNLGNLIRAAEEQPGFFALYRLILPRTRRKKLFQNSSPEFMIEPVFQLGIKRWRDNVIDRRDIKE